MKHEVKKISKIVDELVTFCFKHGTNKMDITVENNENFCKIEMHTDNIDCSNKRVKLLKNLLNSPRQSEIEEYCWELAGENDHDTELSLVGIMVDEAEVEFEDTALTIKLYRYK